MADVTWLGDADPSVQMITMYDHTFVKGVPTSVPDKDPRMGKFKGNALFSVGEAAEAVADEDPDKDAEIAQVRADLDELGVKYRPNTGLDKLREKLAEALG